MSSSEWEDITSSDDEQSEGMIATRVEWQTDNTLSSSEWEDITSSDDEQPEDMIATRVEWQTDNAIFLTENMTANHIEQTANTTSSPEWEDITSTDDEQTDNAMSLTGDLKATQFKQTTNTMDSKSRVSAKVNKGDEKFLKALASYNATIQAYEINDPDPEEVDPKDVKTINMLLCNNIKLQRLIDDCKALPATSVLRPDGDLPRTTPGSLASDPPCPKPLSPIIMPLVKVTPPSDGSLPSLVDLDASSSHDSEDDIPLADLRKKPDWEAYDHLNYERERRELANDQLFFRLRRLENTLKYKIDWLTRIQQRPSPKTVVYYKGVDRLLSLMEREEDLKDKKDMAHYALQAKKEDQWDLQGAKGLRLEKIFESKLPEHLRRINEEMRKEAIEWDNDQRLLMMYCDESLKLAYLAMVVRLDMQMWKIDYGMDMLLEGLMIRVVNLEADAILNQVRRILLLLPCMFDYEVRGIDEVDLVEGGLDSSMRLHTALRLYNFQTTPEGLEHLRSIKAGLDAMKRGG